MELKIDTAKDSREDIQHAVTFLQAFLKESAQFEKARQDELASEKKVLPSTEFSSTISSAIPSAFPPAIPSTPENPEESFNSTPTLPSSPLPSQEPTLTNLPREAKEPPKEDDLIEIAEGALNMFDEEAVTNAPGSPDYAKGTNAEVLSPTSSGETKADATDLIQNIITKPEKSDVTKTQHRMISVSELLKDPVKVIFKKNDGELEEVQKLKKASKTTSENLRIIAYN